MIYALLFVFPCLLIVYKYLQSTRNITKVPSGLRETYLEKGLPIIGILHQIESPLCQYLIKLSKKHGPIYRVRLGMRDIVVLNDFDTIKKTLKDQGNAFAGRWKTKHHDIFTKNMGVLLTDGDAWSEQRSFIIQIFRDFGLGKSRSLEIVLSESSNLIEELNNYGGKCVDFSKIIPFYAANIIAKYMMNKRFARNDSQLEPFIKLMLDVVKNKNYLQTFHLMFPVFDQMEWFCKFAVSFTSQLKLYRNANQMFQDLIDDHTQVVDVNSEGQDFMDRFLIKQHQLDITNKLNHSFTNEQLCQVAFDLLVSGYETSSTNLVWSMMFMSKHLDIQKRVYEEITEEIGTERLPTMTDKKSLNYTQAVMDEIMRWSTTLPLALIHRTLDNASVNGYYIPKNTLIFPNLLACNMDERVWEKPQQFYPEHFLKIDIHKELKYNPREELISFSVGKRQCLGEALARMEFFVFFTSILQRFQIKFEEELSEVEYQEVLRGNEGVIRFCKANKFQFHKRSQE